MANTTGKKFGGRKKGVLNKANQRLVDMAKSKGKDPVEFMLDVMNDESQPLNIRLDASKAVAPYTNRKMPTAIEQDNTHSFPDRVDITLIKPK